MIRLWTYNELSERMDIRSQTASLYLPRPGTSISRHNVRIDKEIMSVRAWSDYDLSDVLTGTFVDIGSSGAPITRGVGGTQSTSHNKGAPAWVEWLPNRLNSEVIEDFNTISHSAEANALINCSIPDGHGGWFIGGEFTSIDGETKLSCARIKASGVLDPNFIADCDDSVFTPAVLSLSLDPTGEFLAIGGAFNTYNGTVSVSRIGVVIVNANTGALIQSFGIDGSGAVGALEWDGDTLYVGGTFIILSGASRSFLGKFIKTGTLWELDTWDPSLDAQVRSIVKGTQLFIGGGFTTIDGETRNGAAAFVDDELTDWNPDLNGQANIILEYEGSVYVGGNFTTANGSIPRDNLVKVDSVYGAVDVDFTADCDNTVYDVEVADGLLLLAGEFNSINSSTALYFAGVASNTGDLIVDYNLNDAATSISISISRIGVFGDFTTPRDRIAIFDASLAFSPIGRYQAELEWRGAKINNVIWKTYKDGNLIYESDPVVEFESITGGVRVPGPDLSLPSPRAEYEIEASITTATGILLERVGFGARSEDAIYLIPIGRESGHRFDDSDTFTMPTPDNPDKNGNVYTLTLPDQADTPVAMTDHHFYKIYCVLAGDDPEYKGGNRFRLIISVVGDAIETYDTPYTNLFSAEIDWEEPATTYNLTLRFEDTAGSSEIQFQEINLTHTESDRLNPDQVQIEREINDGTSTGPQFGRYISDWIPVPSNFQVEYANQGPITYEYRYRVRYRDFRRDGVEEERGPAQVVSQWSNWTPFV